MAPLSETNRQGRSASPAPAKHVAKESSHASEKVESKDVKPKAKSQVDQQRASPQKVASWKEKLVLSVSATLVLAGVAALVFMSPAAILDSLTMASKSLAEEPSKIVGGCMILPVVLAVAMFGWRLIMKRRRAKIM